MSSADLISIVITTYNRSDALACVVGALEQQLDKNFEVVIADDGSTPEHQARIHAMQASVSYSLIHVWHPDVGFTAARARNLGVAASSGNYLILLDGDCVPEVDFVARHRSLAQQSFFVNGSRVLLSEAFTRKALKSQVPVIGQPWPVWIGRRFRGESSKLGPKLRLPDFSWRLQPSFKWKAIRSCNMALFKSDYVAVNGFDETFVGWGHEDADFVLRLHNAGLCRKNGYWSTEVYHLWHRESSRDMENVNARLVRERISTRQITASIGYHESLGATEVLVTQQR
jgi:glycosyltransferase involved in cell wall biosynthesis